MKYKTRREYYIYRERGNRSVNKSAFVFKNISGDCLRQGCRINFSLYVLIGKGIGNEKGMDPTILPTSDG